MKNSKFFIQVNLITFYRLIAAPVLMTLLIIRELTPFSYLLALSFLTDAVDGYLARRFKVVSVLGARVDSVADDLTVLVAIIGLFMYFPGFLRSQWLPAGVMVVLYAVQNCFALIRYQKLTSFHTYSAKVAAVLQGVFLVLCFFLKAPAASLFDLVAAATIIDLLEEILLILVLPKWEANVKGLYWVFIRRTPA
jgi:CDP-diacylglycerol--glycerol-3-phosphate 3-phosphatidyltransferase